MPHDPDSDLTPHGHAHEHGGTELSEMDLRVRALMTSKKMLLSEQSIGIDGWREKLAAAVSLRRDLLGLDDAAGHRLVLDIETGAELARVDTGSPVQSVVFPAVGFDRDVLLRAGIEHADAFAAVSRTAEDSATLRVWAARLDYR